MSSSKLVSLDGLAALVADGCQLAIPADTSGIAMAATRALIRRGVRNLNLVLVPTSSLQADLLIGAGCVAAVEGAAVSLGEHGLAPRFREAVEQGAIEMRDATCPAIHAGLTAAEKGVPFLPIRGVLGTDVIVRSEPVGVVAGIVPWNVPQFVTMSKLAPALLTGCTIVIKPAPETPLSPPWPRVSFEMLPAIRVSAGGLTIQSHSVPPTRTEWGFRLLVRDPADDAETPLSLRAVYCTTIFEEDDVRSLLLGFRDLIVSVLDPHAATARRSFTSRKRSRK